MIAPRVYRRSRRDVRVWARGAFVLHVYQIGRGWYAEVHDLRSPRGTWPVEVLCRSRSRAVDVGRRMLSLSIARDRAVGMW